MTKIMVKRRIIERVEGRCDCKCVEFVIIINELDKNDTEGTVVEGDVVGKGDSKEFRHDT